MLTARMLTELKPFLKTTCLIYNDYAKNEEVFFIARTPINSYSLTVALQTYHLN